MGDRRAAPMQSMSLPSPEAGKNLSLTLVVGSGTSIAAFGHA